MFDVIDSISCRMWLDTSTLLPDRPQSLIRRIVRRRTSGSMPRAARQDQHIRVVRESLRQLDALTHALAVRSESSCRLRPTDPRFHRARPTCRGRPRPHAVQAHERRHPLEPGHPFVECVLLGTESKPRIQRRIVPDWLAKHLDRALARFEASGDELHERGLARTVRAAASRYSSGNSQRDSLRPMTCPVPLGTGAQPNHAGACSRTVSGGGRQPRSPRREPAVRKQGRHATSTMI